MLDERDDLGRTAAPAGGLAISANDMARWLMIQLDHGAIPGGGRLFSEAAHEQMWTPGHACSRSIPRPATLAPTQAQFNSYALGWEVRDYRGTKIVWHGGAVLGFKTAVVLIPDKHVGFAIEINSEDGEIILGLMYELLDHYLGLPASRLAGKVPRREANASSMRRLKAYQAAVASSRQGRAVPAARELCGHLSRSLVRRYRDRRVAGHADDRFQVDAAHERHARALAIRHVPHPARPIRHRAGLRQLRPGCRRQGRACDDEGRYRRSRISATTTRTCCSSRSLPRDSDAREPLRLGNSRDAPDFDRGV